VPGNEDNDYTKSVTVLTAGMSVSHCRIIEKIGAGGMGEVYLTEDTKRDRKMSLKFAPFHLCQDTDPVIKEVYNAKAGLARLKAKS
jgi:hypothetical protein